MTTPNVTPTPPAIEGIVWREARREDVPALQQLQIVSNQLYGPLDPLAIVPYADLFDPRATTATICAVAPSGDIVAFGSVAIHTLAHEHRGYLDGLVHPDLRKRGLGTYLLEWAEALAGASLRSLSPDRPAVLSIDFMDRRDDAIPLYTRRGFTFKLSEDTMRRDLYEQLPDLSSPNGVDLTPWSQTDPHLFYETYSAAFRHRPGFPGWSEDVWRHAFTGTNSFRPDLSLLAHVGDMPIGYILCEIDQERNRGATRKEGWVPQMGVRFGWRGRGVGAALLGNVLHAFRSESLDDALLDVNVNNPEARRLYERLGFHAVVRRTVYVKPAQPSTDK